MTSGDKSSGALALGGGSAAPPPICAGRPFRHAVLFTIAMALAACTTTPPEPAGPLGSPADRIKAHVAYLASDALEGREPGTAGYDQAAAYVQRELEKAGVKPGADGGWFQQVPLVVTERVMADAGFDLMSPSGARRRLAEFEDFVLRKPTDRERIAVEAQLAFVGYGVRDDETGYDDYGQIDVTGKIVVMFSSAPRAFEGAKRAYLGSTDVKRRLAAERGAVGLVVLPTLEDEEETPWERVAEGAKDPAAAFLGADGLAHAPGAGVAANARLSASGGRLLFAGARASFDDLRADEAANRPLHAFPMPGAARVGGMTRISRIESPNVVGIVEGRDRRLRDEVVVISAHLDHLGKRRNPKPGEDSIRNGAMDNATGVAMLIETAQKLAKAPPRRSVVFVAFTAEERGLIGSEYFAKNPPLGDRTIVSNVNLDMPMTLYPLGDVIGFGAERSSLGPLIERLAGEMGLALTPDPYPEEGIFARSDHFSFVVEQGVPAVFLMAGLQNGGDLAFQEFMKKHYHRPSDDTSLPIDYEAAATFAELNARIAVRIADDDAVPVWNPGDYFGERFGKKKIP